MAEVHLGTLFACSSHFIMAFLAPGEFCLVKLCLQWVGVGVNEDGPSRVYLLPLDDMCWR